MEQLERIGIRTLRDLRLADDRVLRPVLGHFAARLRARAAGIDDRPVVPDADQKQISSEETFDVALDRIRAKFGSTSVTRGTELGREREAKAPPRK